MDPIDRPDFNPSRARPANPSTIETITSMTEHWRNLDQEAKTAYKALCAEVKAAKAAGHSYSQLAAAVGVSIATIQRMSV
jgi:hypothetical protein